MQADTRALCFRFAPESRAEAGPRWSHPIDLERALNSSARFISLPVRPSASEEPLISLDSEEGPEDDKGLRRGSYLRDITTLETAAAPTWELHGLQSRVARRVKHYIRSVAAAI
jgi:hypothetical protein